MRQVNQLSPTLHIIINVNSGAASKMQTRRVLEEIFGASGIEARISVAETGTDLIDLARRAAEGFADTIVAGGGDGTVNAVARALVGTNKRLGVLPLGTLNHFAKDLRIPLDLQGAARTIIAGHTIAIDVGEVNGSTFINNSSLGLYPKIVRWRKRNQRLGHGKWPAFLWAAVTVFRRYPFLDVRLIVDGKKFETRTPFVFVGNNAYEMEGFNIGRRPRLDAGKLSLYVTNQTGRLGLIRTALRALFKRLRQAKDFVAMRTTEVSVETRRKRVRVAMDGEVALMKSPLRYRIRPLALRVIVPEDRQGPE